MIRMSPRAVLRAVAGRHHGRCFPLDDDCVLGRSPDCDVPLDDENLAPREVTLRAAAKGVRASVVSTDTASLLSSSMPDGNVDVLVGWRYDAGTTTQLAGRVACPTGKYLEENVAAASLELSADDLAAIEAAVPASAVAGDRYPDMSSIGR